jgi:DNA-binding PadR family transcriptional regulator
VETPGRPIADEILAYLVKHPEAQDTLEGITEWWLLEQRIRSAVAEVDGALRNLVAQDLLVTRRCADGRTYYALNRAKEREIRKHLREAASAREKKTDAGSNNRRS